jgi:hypothetical protein
MHESARIHRAAGEFVGKETIGPSSVLDGHVDFGDQQSALDGRLETRHKEPVVPPGIGAGHRAARVAAQAVGRQPFPAAGAAPVAADIATEDQARDLFRR